METKIELINGNYYDVTYDKNEVAILMVLIGNHDDMLSQVNFMLKEKSDEIISLKEELQSKEFGEKVSQLFNKKNEEKIRKVKSLLNSLRGDYISTDAIGKFLQHALQDKYSLEDFQCEIKGCLFSTDLEQENNKLKSQVNELTHELKKLRRMQWDKKPIDALRYANEAKKIFKTKEEHDDFLKFIKEIFPDCPNDQLPKFN